MQAVYIAPGKVLLSWDSGLGPTWDVDPYGAEIKAKFLGTCEVWRCANAVGSGGPAVKLGETEAEAFYDVTAPNGATLTYWVMEQTAVGSRQVGPTVDVLMPQNGSDDPAVLTDATPPSAPQDLTAKASKDGNLLAWLPSQDAESGLLAYFVYDSNQDQPDSVVWAADGQKVASFLDRSPNADKGYCVGAVDVALNLSELCGPVVPTSLSSALILLSQYRTGTEEGYASYPQLSIYDVFTGLGGQTCTCQMRAAPSEDPLEWPVVAGPTDVWLDFETDYQTVFNDIVMLCGWPVQRVVDDLDWKNARIIDVHFPASGSYAEQDSSTGQFTLERYGDPAVWSTNPKVELFRVHP